MRLERFARLTMRYGRGSWHKPYGGIEGAGFGDGDGTVSGEIEGELIWANYPRRREDGVWTPNVRGRIVTDDGDEVLFSVHGQSVLEQAPGTHRAILARVELTTGAGHLRWVNTCFFVAEGEIDEQTDDVFMDVYACVNETAVGPPAIGEQPPERFRQSGHGSAPN
jgi:hypothetical protein